MFLPVQVMWQGLDERQDAEDEDLNGSLFMSLSGDHGLYLKRRLKWHN